jgi:hypothetical protein
MVKSPNKLGRFIFKFFLCKIDRSQKICLVLEWFGFQISDSSRNWPFEYRTSRNSESHSLRLIKNTNL